MFRRTLLVDILCVFFGIGTWVCVNGLWVELPLLVSSQPEGWQLPSYMSVAICLANIAPLLYSAAKWLAPRFVTEKPVIYLTMTIGCVATLLLSLYWDRTTEVFGKSRSTALISLVFFLAMVDCSSRVLFLPFMANFKEIYLTSYFVGEGLSGFVPSIFALVQGVGGNPECILNVTANVVEAHYPDPRFSIELFFYLLLGMMILSALSFLLLNQNFLVQNALAAESSANSSAVLLGGNPAAAPINYESTAPHASPLLQSSATTTPANDEQPGPSSRLPESDDDDDSVTSVRIMGVTPRLKPKPRFKSASESEVEVSTQQQQKVASMSLYLLTVQFIVCSLSNGVFPSIQSYSCLPYGTETYHWAVTLSSMTNPAICFLDFFLPRPTKTSVTAVSIAGFGIASYVMVTAVMSPNPPLQSEAIGEILLVFSWIALVGLFTYVRISIAAIFRTRGKEGLFWIGAVTQIGSATGALLMFFIVNFTNVFQSFQPCAV